MIQKLPTNGFAWEKEVNDFILEKKDKLVKKNKKGYILAVDLEYPKELQNKNDELPVLAAKMRRRIYSTHQKSESSIEVWSKTEKTCFRLLGLNNATGEGLIL